MANPLALKALRLGGKVIKKVTKKLKNQTKLQTKEISFRPKPGDGSKNYAQKLDYLVKTSPVKTGKKRAAWADKKGLPEYPHTAKGKMIRNAADKYEAKRLKEATGILSRKGKKLKAGESTSTSRMLANSKAYGTTSDHYNHYYPKYKAGEGLTSKGVAAKNKSKKRLHKAFHEGDLGGGVEDHFRVLRGKGKEKGGAGIWKQMKKGKAQASVLPTAGLLKDGKKK